MSEHRPLTLQERRQILRLARHGGPESEIMQHYEATVQALEAQLAEIDAAWKATNIGGIYDNIDSPAEALTQMAAYIKALKARIEQVQDENFEMLNDLALYYPAKWPKD